MTTRLGKREFAVHHVWILQIIHPKTISFVKNIGIFVGRPHVYRVFPVCNIIRYSLIVVTMQTSCQHLTISFVLERIVDAEIVLGVQFD